MLSDEDKARIRAEEEFRAQVRGEQPQAKPVKVQGFTDKMNKVRFYMWLFIAVPIAIIMFIFAIMAFNH